MAGSLVEGFALCVLAEARREGQQHLPLGDAVQLWSLSSYSFSSVMQRGCAGAGFSRNLSGADRAVAGQQLSVSSSAKCLPASLEGLAFSSAHFSVSVAFLTPACENKFF